jgi:hypothetical protein
LLARPRESRGGTFRRFVGVIGFGVFKQLALVAGSEDIGDVEECSAFDLGTQVHEGCLHAGKDSIDLRAIDVSDDSSIPFTFDKKLGQGTILDDRDADLGPLGVDHEHVVHESSAIRCAHSGASRHGCRDEGSRMSGSRCVGNTQAD